MSSNTAQKAITTAEPPYVMAITPNGRTDYVVCSAIGDKAPGQVVPVNTATNTAGKAIGGVGRNPVAIAITP